MYSKQNKLSIFQGNTIKTEVIEIKRVIQLPGLGLEKNAGGKNEGFSHYVIENTESEIAKFGLAVILLKNKLVRILRVYAIEIKWLAMTSPSP